jgi:methyl-accepting chemotaxis protein
MEVQMPMDTQFPPFFEEALKSLNIPSGNIEALLDIYKKNIELMNTNLQIATEATNTIMELQRKHIENAIEQWQEQVKSASSVDPSDLKIEDAAEATKDKLTETLDHINEVNAVVEKSSKKIKDTFQKRMKESVDEVVELSKKK